MKPFVAVLFFGAILTVTPKIDGCLSSIINGSIKGAIRTGVKAGIARAAIKSGAKSGASGAVIAVKVTKGVADVVEFGMDVAEFADNVDKDNELEVTTEMDQDNYFYFANDYN